MPLEPNMIRAASDAVSRVKDIDETIEKLVVAVDRDAATWGHKVRDALGDRRLTQFGDQYLAQVVHCAIVNALLLQRNGIVSEHFEIVNFPDQPCPEQFASGDGEEEQS